MTSFILTNVLALLACAALSGDVEPPQTTGTRLLQSGAVAGVTVGASSSTVATWAAAERDGVATRRLAHGIVVDGVRFEAVDAYVTADRVTALELRAEVSGSEAVAALARLTDVLCKGSGGIDRLMPSPLGTPTPGEPWDPVRTSEGTCSGQAGKAPLQVREDTAHASDFSNAELLIRLGAH